MIDITVLGTAATMPLPDRALASVLLSCTGNSILFDCGEGTQTAARKAHVSLMKLSLIALTHYHGDHIFGLPGLLQTMACLGRREALYVCGPDGLHEALRALLTLAGPLPFDIIALSIPDDGICLGSTIPGWPLEARLVPFKTKHRTVSSGYRFELSRPGRFNPEAAKALHVPVQKWSTLQHGEDVELETGEIITPDSVLGPPRAGLCFCISGDSAPCASLTEGASGADLFICEATYGDEDNAEQAALYGHSTFSQAARTAAQAGAKRLLLTHFSQMMEVPEDYLDAARADFADAECAADGMKIRLCFED